MKKKLALVEEKQEKVVEAMTALEGRLEASSHVLKATPAQFNKMISRQVAAHLPEHKLWLAVVGQAVTDAHNGERGARRYLQDKNNLAYRMLGLDGDFMVEQFRKHAHWGDTIKK